jgi:hypothetical protein
MTTLNSILSLPFYLSTTLATLELTAVNLPVLLQVVREDLMHSKLNNWHFAAAVITLSA